MEVVVVVVHLVLVLVVQADGIIVAVLALIVGTLMVEIVARVTLGNVQAV